MYELAKRIVCSIIAMVLSTTVSIVQGLLPLNPQWLERVANLAWHFRALARGEALPADQADGEPFEGLSSGGEDLQRMLAAYQHLWDFVQAVRVKGLALDEDFLARIEREWSVSTLLTYLRRADETLQASAADAQSAAARLLSPAHPTGGGSA